MSFDPINDPMGQAIHDYYYQKKCNKLVVKSDIAEDDNIEVSYLFREFNQMPKLEKTALKNCRGSVLDVGAGAGCHSLWLQQKRLSVTALEISHLTTEVLTLRGIKKVLMSNFFDAPSNETYDTLLFLMNGIGIAQTLKDLPVFFEKCKQLLNPDGQILLDSSDLIYLFGNDKEGFLIDLMGAYYGEVTYQLRYGRTKGIPFHWLFIDFHTLTDYALQAGLRCELLESGEHYDYLAKLTLL